MGWRRRRRCYAYLHCQFYKYNCKDTILTQVDNLDFPASRRGGSGSKNTDWTNMLSAMGTVSLITLAQVQVSVQVQVWVDLILLLHQQIFKKDGSGNYAENDYNINARYVGNNIQFRIQFRDDDTGDSNKAVSKLVQHKTNT